MELADRPDNISEKILLAWAPCVHDAQAPISWIRPGGLPFVFVDVYEGGHAEHTAAVAKHNRSTETS